MGAHLSQHRHQSGSYRLGTVVGRAFAQPSATRPINRTLSVVTIAGVLAAGGALGAGAHAAEQAGVNPQVSAAAETGFNVAPATAVRLPDPQPVVEAQPIEATAPIAPAAEQEVSVNASAGSIVATAMRYLGRPYVFGASGPSRFDCSGFTSYVYRQFGINLPHSSHSQGRMGTPVSAAQAQAGDLVYYTHGHVGIYLGNGKIVHASTPSTGVTISSVSSSGTPHFRHFG